MDRKEDQDTVIGPTGTRSAKFTDTPLGSAAEMESTQNRRTLAGKADPRSNSLSSPSPVQDSKWVFRSADSDLESENNYSQKSFPARITTPPIPYDAVFRFTNTSPTQSEGTAMTSWDEWDEPSDSLGIDLITLTRDSLGTQYASLI